MTQRQWGQPRVARRGSKELIHQRPEEGQMRVCVGALTGHSGPASPVPWKN